MKINQFINQFRVNIGVSGSVLIGISGVNLNWALHWNLSFPLLICLLALVDFLFISLLRWISTTKRSG